VRRKWSLGTALFAPAASHLSSLHSLTLAPRPGARFARARTDSADAIGAEAGTATDEGDDQHLPGSASKNKASMYAPRRMAGSSTSPGGGSAGGGLLSRLPRGRSAGLWLVVPVSWFLRGERGAAR